MQILKVHKAHRVMTQNGFHCMQMYFIVTSGELFHDQWYEKDGTEPFGHFDVVGNDRIDTICVKCLVEKTGKIGSTVLAAVNGTTRDASMFEFMTFVLKFGIHYVSNRNFYVGWTNVSI